MLMGELFPRLTGPEYIAPQTNMSIGGSTDYMDMLYIIFWLFTNFRILALQM